MLSECGQGFLTLNQSILVVVVGSVLTIFSLIAIIIVSVQYSKVMTLVRRSMGRGKSGKDESKSVTWPRKSGHNAAFPWSSDAMNPVEGPRRRSTIPRPLYNPTTNPYLSSFVGASPMRQQIFASEEPKVIANENLYKLRDKSITNDNFYKSREQMTTSDRLQQEKPKPQQKGMMVVKKATQSTPTDTTDRPLPTNVAAASGAYSSRDRLGSQMGVLSYDNEPSNRLMGKSGVISENFVLKPSETISY